MSPDPERDSSTEADETMAAERDRGASSSRAPESTAAFRRPDVRHPMARRRLTVSRIQELAPDIRRVTFVGDDLRSMSSDGPDDHVTMFFPVSGAEVVGRDFTPREVRSDTAELDVDFVLHDDPGPASAWASTAEAGQPLAIDGPRGSRLIPSAERLLLVADPTALPAVARWLGEVAPTVTVRLVVRADPDTTTTYLGPLADRAEIIACPDDDTMLDAVTGLEIEHGTFIWAAGEAGLLVPLRRHWRQALGLPRAQVQIGGYWRRGVSGPAHRPDC